MAPPKPRMTLATRLVLHALLELTPSDTYGRHIGHTTGLPSGTISPILNRLETVGWVTGTWEDIDERTEGRRRRRYYQLTPTGTEKARTVGAQMRTATDERQAGNGSPT